AGVAAHHAGMLPVFKETVEELFEAGLVKVVFATETLSLGINMPARTVVIEDLWKFQGERHELLTPGEYTQLTGRAGRRGIDEVGYAVVLWSPFVPFEQVAGLASTRTYALTSSFRPTYNMAVNLVRQYERETAHHLLNLSFAQYRADRDVVRLEAQIERTGSLMTVALREAACERGDVDEYRSRHRAADGDGGQGGRRAGSSSSRAVAEALEKVKPGDVLVLTGGKSAGKVVVVSTAHRRGDEVRLGALTAARRYLSLSARDFRSPPTVVAKVDLPTPYAPRSPEFQRQTAQALVATRLPSSVASRAPEPASNGAEAQAGVAGCPDLARHLRAAERAERLEKDFRRLHRRVEGRTESLARQFDRVLRVLEAWGYVDGWSLTQAGEVLTRIYHECDLLVAEGLRAGLFDHLDPAAVAVLASALTFEARRAANGHREQWFPSPRVRRRWAELERMAAEINAAEKEAGLPLTRAPDPGFFAAAYGWASGEDLGEVIAEEEITGGDFVRNVKQLVDLLRQLGLVAPAPDTAAAAAKAADSLFRGVVAASSVVGSPSYPTS
ncbi:MAG: helicase-related protein, partial [Acidimicrobiales bacterium]